MHVKQNYKQSINNNMMMMVTFHSIFTVGQYYFFILLIAWFSCPWIVVCAKLSFLTCKLEINGMLLYRENINLETYDYENMP